MEDTLLKVLPLALGGAVNPVGIILIILLLTKDHPLKRVWLFLAGFSFALVVLACGAQIILKYTYGISIHKNIYSSIINIALGILLILLAIFHKGKQRAVLKNIGNAWNEFIYGFLFMIVLDISTLVLYFAAIKIIFDAKLSYVDDVLVFIIVILIIASTMVLPAFIATIMPKKSAAVLDLLSNFMVKHGQLINKVVVIVIGIYLIYTGTKFFF